MGCILGRDPNRCYVSLTGCADCHNWRDDIKGLAELRAENVALNQIVAKTRQAFRASFCGEIHIDDFEDIVRESGLEKVLKRKGDV